VTLDQLFVDAGDQIDRLIDDHLDAQPTGPTHAQRTPRRIGSFAAVALAVIAVVGLTALVVRRDPGSPEQPSSPSLAQPAAPSLFDNGVAMIVFLRHGSTPEQADLVRQQLLRQGDVIDTSRVEYLDASQSLALARRVLANDPASLAQVEAAMPTMFHLYANPQISQTQLAELGRQLLSMPNVIDVRVRDAGSSAGLSVNCDPSPCPADPAGRIPSAPTETTAALP
jgi:hypothetical protein